MNRIVCVLSTVVLVILAACNNSLSSSGSDSERQGKGDRSQRTVIDNAEYVDFTSEKYDAHTIRREDMVYALNGSKYVNGNSVIEIKAKDGTIEITSDAGVFNGKQNCQVYGVFGFDIQAASSDCLYIRKHQETDGFVIIDGNLYRNDAIPDLAVCLPLYGYSRNRIEVSSIMDGYIVMPSGTYWKK